ncbi:DUF1460 domain-containing protein [Aeromonas popoffii]|jgi:hypothetical protein|uniref:DUF1460 domain-containing protein n=1 Tax=Aeromonas popoffii TaxID=70856 RepID=A0ABS5GWM8_9GAMM|nr:DUF1460 domain-containing protein [Aeromonas popoffii]MBR7631229.1 DUF1460 domain-containing protein [Aeromonas popoffii]
MMKLIGVALLTFAGVAVAGNGKNLDFYNIEEQQLADMFAQHQGGTPGQSIKDFSRLFLDNPYVANRLVGASDTQEKLVVDFGELDCFTYLDYVESLRHSTSVHNFIENVMHTRYVNGEVNYLTRKHFFSDWVHSGNKVSDVTHLVGNYVVTVPKILNLKEDGGHYIPGLGVKDRDISYIPGDRVDEDTLSLLEDGDYIGIYTNITGLDVTHTGIFIRGENGPVLRNASSVSTNMKVVDSPFLDYVKNKPGILVYRARDDNSPS